MRTFRTITAMVAATVLPTLAGAQTTNDLSVATVEEPHNPWAFTASAYGYLVPESRDYLNLNFTADRGWAHFEARYNYEALDSGSVWVGYNFHVGETLVFEATPQLGGVFGHLTGIAPGWNLSLSYKRWTLSSQNEYVFEVGDSSGNFFYTWSELYYTPWNWCRVGLAVQRTKAYQSELDIQRGFLVGVSYKKIELTTYVFNLGWTDPTVVLAGTISF